MNPVNIADHRSSQDGHAMPPPLPPSWTRGMGGWLSGGSWQRRLLTAALALVVGYGIYFWEIRRVVVPPNHVMILLKKDGYRTLGGDNVIVPRPPDPKDPQYAGKLAQWQRQYEGCNGILEQVYPEGTYFAYSPFDYERQIISIEDGALVPAGKVGIVIKLFGERMPADAEGQVAQVLSDGQQRGPLGLLLTPGRYNQYANTYAYQIKHVNPVQVEPGHRGVVTILAGPPAKDPNQYLVASGEQGMQPRTEMEGFLYVNPYEKRVTPISIVSHRFEMSGKDIIQFPSADSFDIKLEGFVEWTVNPDRLPLTYVQYANGSELISYLEEGVILPYARAYCRLVGSEYKARDFISGQTKQKFQDEFEKNLRAECWKQGIEIKQALVRNIVPPDAIKQPINEREIAKEQILQYEQQIKVAESQAMLATQEETSTQNKAVGEANKEVVKVVKTAEQKRDVALTLAAQDLSVAKLHLEAAQKQADALIAKGTAEANVTLLQKQAEAQPLREQVTAFGDGDAYARFFFYQKVAPSIKSILANTDGPFGELFRQFAVPATRPSSKGGNP